MTSLWLSNGVGFAVCMVQAWGMHVSGQKHRAGWLWGVVAEIGWLVYAILLKQWSLIPWSFVYSAIFLHNYRKWSKS